MSRRHVLIVCIICVAMAAGFALWRTGTEESATGPSPQEPVEVKLASLDPKDIPSVGTWQRKMDETVAIYRLTENGSQ